MTSSTERLLETLESLRKSRFPDIPSDLVKNALRIESDHPDTSERDLAQRKLEVLIEKYVANG